VIKLRRWAFELFDEALQQFRSMVMVPSSVRLTLQARSTALTLEERE